MHGLTVAMYQHEGMHWQFNSLFVFS